MYDEPSTFKLLDLVLDPAIFTPEYSPSWTLSTIAKGLSLTKSLMSLVTEENFCTSSDVILVANPISSLPSMAEATTTTSSIDSTRIFRRLVSPTVNRRLSIVCDPFAEVTTTEYGPPGLRPLALNLPFASVVFETFEFVGL